MTAQLANGGYEIQPKIILNDDKDRNLLKQYLASLKESDSEDLTKPNQKLTTNLMVSQFLAKPLFKNQENINFIKDAMFAATNEPGGTSYRSRFKSKKFMFAGKTGSSQVIRFTEAQREAEVKQNEIDYKQRDHALFIAFAPVSNPKYAISVIVEHGGSGSSAAAPVAQKIIKKVIERDEMRSKNYNLLGEKI